MRRQRAGGIAGMDSGLLDVLHHSADEDVFAVGERVNIDLDRVGEIGVDQHRRVAGDDDRRSSCSVRGSTGSRTISIPRPPST